MTQSYTAEFEVPKSREVVFNAINNVRAWWSGQIEGNTDILGESFTYKVEGIHYSKQKIVTLMPQRVEWEVVEAQLTFVGDPEEWKGTHIVFDLTEDEGGTKVLFTHQGLSPELECFKTCSDAWGMLILGNLYQYILTGESQPSPFTTK